MKYLLYAIGGLAAWKTFAPDSFNKTLGPVISKAKAKIPWGEGPGPQATAVDSGGGYTLRLDPAGFPHCIDANGLQVKLKYCQRLIEAQELEGI